MRWILTVIAIVLGSLWSSQALAWGASGHRTVCEIALRNLTPTARSEVTRLLASHPVIPIAQPLNRELGWACTYPDRTVQGGPGRRDSEHFVNYARTLSTVTLESGCGEAHECVVTAILSDFALLRSPFLPDRHRAVALIYLGHWVGDIHQPLHNSFADDRGGGRVNVSGLCSGGLHSAWDTCILERQAFANVETPSIPVVRDLAATWGGQVTDLERAEWLSAAPWQWSAESYPIAISSDTGYCVMVQGTCRYSANQVTFGGSNPRTVAIDDAYMIRAMPIIQRRITQAGIRLAHLVNLALDPAYRAGL